MNNLKSKAGFTLVELIVVIAILAILAGVGTAAYTGYIAKAQEAADMQILGNVNTAVQGLAAAQGKTVTTITVTKSSGAIVVDPTDAAPVADVTKLIGGALQSSDFKASWTTATWSATTGKWTLSN